MVVLRPPEGVYGQAQFSSRRSKDSSHQWGGGITPGRSRNRVASWPEGSPS